MAPDDGASLGTSSSFETEAPIVQLKPLALLALGGLLVAGAVVFARGRAEPPARCAEGMVALGPRCCGAGQSLEGGLCVGAPTACAEGLTLTPAGCVAPAHVVRIAGGKLTVGPGDWEALGVVAPYETAIDAFAIDAYEVTELRYADCVAAGACVAVAMRGEPGLAIANITAEEGAQFCAWAGGDLPEGDQLAFAISGVSGRRYPWGDTGAVCRRAAWGLVKGPCASAATGAEIAGSHPDGASPDGVFDLAGNVAEWTRPPPDGAPTTSARGGSYEDSAAKSLRAYSTVSIDRKTRSPAIGFRCVYAVETAESAFAPRGVSTASPAP